MKASTPSSLVFRIQIKLNSTIHRDAIALLHDLPKQNLAEVVALFLQYGAMAQRDINAGRCGFDAGAQAPTLKAVESKAMPDTARSTFTGAQGESGLVPTRSKPLASEWLWRRMPLQFLCGRTKK